MRFGEDILKALEIKFNFLRKIYENTSLIENLTIGIEKKKEKDPKAKSLTIRNNSNL